MTTNSARLTNLTAPLHKSHDCSCYASTPILAPTAAATPADQYWHLQQLLRQQTITGTYTPLTAAATPADHCWHLHPTDCSCYASTPILAPTAAATPAHQYWYLHPTHCSNTLVYAHTTSRTLPTSGVIRGSLGLKKLKVACGAISALQHVGRLYPHPNEFPSFISRGATHHGHERPLIAKEGTVQGILLAHS